MSGITLYTAHICPYCQRVELLLRLKGLWEKVTVKEIDLSKPRPEELLQKTGGTTSVPVIELADGTIIKESLVIVRYLEDRFPGHSPSDPTKRAILNMWIALEDPFVGAGYRLMMNKDEAKRKELAEAFTTQARKLDAFLRRYSTSPTYLFDEISLAEVTYASFFQRFKPIISHYEGWDFPTEGLERFLKYREGCLSLRELYATYSNDDLVKAYYDYALGTGNARMPEGRTTSTFSLDFPLRKRPMPPADKWKNATPLTDAQLGLTA